MSGDNKIYSKIKELPFSSFLFLFFFLSFLLVFFVFFLAWGIHEIIKRKKKTKTNKSKFGDCKHGEGLWAVGSSAGRSRTCASVRFDWLSGTEAVFWKSTGLEALPRVARVGFAPVSRPVWRAVYRLLKFFSCELLVDGRLKNKPLGASVVFWFLSVVCSLLFFF